MKIRILLPFVAAAALACQDRSAEANPAQPVRSAMLERLPDIPGELTLDQRAAAAFMRDAGPFRLDTSSDDVYSIESGLMLTEKWNTLFTLAHGPVAAEPVRGVIRRYPRPELQGSCFTVAAEFRNAPERVVGEGHAVRGLIFVVRKTYRVESGAPLLIGASMDVHRHVQTLASRIPLAQILGPEAGPIAADRSFGPGAGGRRGIAWFEHAGAWCYRFERDDAVDPRKWPLTPAQQIAFLQAVARF